MLKKIFVIPIILILAFFSFSCLPEPGFGKLVICSSVNQDTYEPVGMSEEFSMDEDSIYANVKVENVYAGDSWTFKWIRQKDNMVIAQKSGNYMPGRNNYINGYIVNRLIPKENSFIAEPGSYLVEFYHNGDKTSSAEFEIKQPKFEIIGASLCSEVGEEGKPVNSKQKFYVNESIYLSVRLNCLLEGKSIKSEWFTGENRIDEIKIEFDKNYFFPIYKVFSLGKTRLPLGRYTVNLYKDSLLYKSYNFELDVDMADMKHYENVEGKFSFNYPNFLKINKNEGENRLELSLSPGSQSYQLTLWILNEGYFPENTNWEESNEDVLLKNLLSGYDLEIVSKNVGTRNGCIEYLYEFKNMQDFWYLNICYLEAEKNLIIFSGFSDENYRYELNKVFGLIFDSFNFSQNGF